MATITTARKYVTFIGSLQDTQSNLNFLKVAMVQDWHEKRYSTIVYVRETKIILDIEDC